MEKIANAINSNVNMYASFLELHITVFYIHLSALISINTYFLFASTTPNAPTEMTVVLKEVIKQNSLGLTEDIR
jgi:uncharacterized membrane protein